MRELEASGRGPQTKLPLAVTFAALLAWSCYAYATVRINADIVAEAIWVQRWLADPTWVWSYPGQRHGGVIEYPVIALAELIAPGNVYAFTLPRVLYIPLVGFLLGLSIRWAFPRWSLWPYALAAAAGPGVLHGFRMISDLYPFGWLLAASGVVLAYGVWSGKITRARALILVTAGILTGLGIYQHASSGIFAFALLMAGTRHWGVRGAAVGLPALGLGLGLIPLGIALFAQPALPTVYSPVNPAVPDLVGVFGLATGPDAWRRALIPNGWGVQQADESLLGMPWGMQAVLNLVIAASLIALVSLYLIRRRRSPDLFFVGTMWLTALVVTIVLISIVSPIWYYGTGIGFLVWVTMSYLGANLQRSIALPLIALILILTSSVAWRAVFLAQPTFLDGARFKLGQVRFNEQIADRVHAAGVQYLFGDYWEVLPIAYASHRRLTPITYNSNRFPLSSDTPETIIVGLTSGYLATPLTLPRWTTAAEAESLATEVCAEVEEINARLPDGVRAFECPSALFAERQ